MTGGKLRYLLAALADVPRSAQVLHLVFSLPESAGSVSAGGASLAAVGLSERPTEDIDLRP